MDIEKLKNNIKLNCNISDAQYWGFYSICGMLMRLRELYRSEHGMMPWEAIPRDDISRWIEEREALWHELEDENLKPIVIEGEQFDPFSVEEINERLKPLGLVYCGGLGRYNKPSFFLAELASFQELYDYSIYLSGRELCRDLSAPMAMLQGRCIFLRGEQIMNHLWERLQEIRATRFDPTLRDILKEYIPDTETTTTEEIVETLKRPSKVIADILTLHEIGEAYEDEATDEWLGIILTNRDRDMDFKLRAIKDILSDTSEMGPLKDIIRKRQKEHLLFYFLMLDPVRKELFHEFLEAFRRFLASEDWELLEQVRKQGYEKAYKMRKEIIERSRQGVPLKEIIKGK